MTDPTEQPYPGDPYTDEASSPADAAARMRACITRARITAIDYDDVGIVPAEGVHVARPQARFRKCKGCGEARDCRFGYCHPCCLPHLRASGA